MVPRRQSHGKVCPASPPISVFISFQNLARNLPRILAHVINGNGPIWFGLVFPAPLGADERSRTTPLGTEESVPTYGKVWRRSRGTTNLVVSKGHWFLHVIGEATRRKPQLHRLHAEFGVGLDENSAEQNKTRKTVSPLSNVDTVRDFDVRRTGRIGGGGADFR